MKIAFLYAAASLAVGALYGYFAGVHIAAVLCSLVVLAVLEVSLSFDNAVVNAKSLSLMPYVWQRRFLTWGMLIAVFGMRLLFPIAIVSIAGHITPVAALFLALRQPIEYLHIVSGAHTQLMGFGGSFLMLVGLRFFFDQEKETHWLAWLEKPLQKLHWLEGYFIVNGLLWAIQWSIRDLSFYFSGMLGVVTYYAVDFLGEYLGRSSTSVQVARAGVAAFISLELLDASCSFDGVIGAFAVSNNIVIIALGLGIGAMFIRSLTLMLVESGALTQYQYLEHGAFWAILSLAGMMFASTLIPIPEIVPGLLGAACIGAAYLTSSTSRKDQPYVDHAN